MALLTPGGDNSGSLSAYLNYLVFDKDYILNTSKSGFIGMPSGINTQHLLETISSIKIDEPGFVYIYVSNESTSDKKIYFDDLSVTVTEGKVQQYSDYYPFGLATEDSWTRVYNAPNKYLYNGGSELNEETKNYETFYRPYDPSLGRFTQLDIMASKYSSSTPYNYAFNDPIYFNDPLGDDASYSYMGRMHNARDGTLPGMDGQNSWDRMREMSMGFGANYFGGMYGHGYMGHGGNTLNIDISKMADGRHYFGFSNGRLNDYKFWSPSQMSVQGKNLALSGTGMSVEFAALYFETGFETSGAFDESDNLGGNMVGTSFWGRGGVTSTDTSGDGRSTGGDNLQYTGRDNRDFALSVVKDVTGIAQMGLSISIYGYRTTGYYNAVWKNMTKAGGKAGTKLGIFGLALVGTDAIIGGQWKRSHTADMVIGGTLIGAGMLGSVPIATGAAVIGGGYFIYDTYHILRTEQSLTEKWFDK
jgi:RHS repeat-associated protein